MGVFRNPSCKWKVLWRWIWRTLLIYMIWSNLSLYPSLYCVFIINYDDGWLWCISDMLSSVRKTCRFHWFVLFFCGHAETLNHSSLMPYVLFFVLFCLMWSLFNVVFYWSRVLCFDSLVSNNMYCIVLYCTYTLSQLLPTLNGFLCVLLLLLTCVDMLVLSETNRDTMHSSFNAPSIY